MEPTKASTSTIDAVSTFESAPTLSGFVAPQSLESRSRSALDAIGQLKTGDLPVDADSDELQGILEKDRKAARTAESRMTDSTTPPLSTKENTTPTVNEIERELFRNMARRDPAMAALYITRKREEIASTQQIEAVLELAEHTEELEWIDHIVQMLNSGEYALPKSDGTAESPDRTIAVGSMDSLTEIRKLIEDEKIDEGKSGTKSFFDAVEEYLSTVLPPDQAKGSVHDMIMAVTGTDYDPSAMKFDQFKNMLQARRSAMSQDGTRLSTEHQYARANIDQIKLQLSGMIDQMYGMMTKLASFN